MLSSTVAIILTTISLLSFTTCEPYQVDSGAIINSAGSQRNVTIGYYSASAPQYGQPMSNLPWNRYTHMVFDGAWPIDQFEFTFGTDEANQQAVQNMQQFVEYAKYYKVTPLLGVGGEQGSKFFSYYLGGSKSRNTFTRNLIALATGYGFEGVVVTWIAPNDDGVGCNTRSPNDVSNFGSFAQEFKKVWRQGYLVVRSTLNGFIGASANYASSQETLLLVQKADVIDLMAYDGYTGNKGKKTGPFSALTAKCPQIPYLSNGIKELLQVLQAQGFPNHKLVLGFTGYGRLFYLPQGYDTNAGISQVAYGAAPGGGITDNLNGTLNACGQTRGFEGVYLLGELIQNGWLASDGIRSMNILARGWEDCAIQPYLYNDQYLLVYDDPMSLQIKSKYAYGIGLAGLSFNDAMGFPSVFLDAALAPWATTPTAS